MCNQAQSNPMRWLKGQVLTHTPGMITCKEFEAFIVDYLDDNLSAAENRVFKIHLAVCRECRDYLKAYKRTVELSKLLSKEPNRPDIEEAPEDLIKAILAAKDS